MLHLPLVKPMYSQPMHLTHELIVCIKITKGRLGSIKKSPCWRRFSTLRPFSELIPLTCLQKVFVPALKIFQGCDLSLRLNRQMSYSTTSLKKLIPISHWRNTISIVRLQEIGSKASGRWLLDHCPALSDVFDADHRIKCLVQYFRIAHFDQF